jgi:hydroxymethylpyrimidine/phosphomethylpyrimidine kinase
MAHVVPIALTIAGSDSSGGAGIQADLKTFSALGVYGASVITALTAQNTQGVHAIHMVPADFVAAQIDAVMSDLDVRAVKIGMAGAADTVETIARALGDAEIPIVLDPVMVAESGDPLLDSAAEDKLRDVLLPLADLVTPNLHEAARLLGQPVAGGETEMRAQARALHEQGPRAVLVKGGHGTGPEAVDILFDGTRYDRLAVPRIDTANRHGTGCTLSSAVAAGLAHGASLRDAVFRAKAYVTDALKDADELEVGHGAGPLHHFHALWRAAEGAGES